MISTDRWGTISYIPEHWQRGLDRCRSDVYSLGAVLYEILGQTVFDGERMDILAEKVRSEPPVAPSTKTSAKLPKSEDLTMQCLQRSGPANWVDE